MYTILAFLAEFSQFFSHIIFRACKNEFITIGFMMRLINCLMLFFRVLVNGQVSFFFSQLDKGRSFLKEFRQGRSDVSLIGSFHGTVFG